jgi:hypothetical protein
MFATMAFRLPNALQDADDAAALDLLTRYFGEPYLCPGCADGVWLDVWDTSTDPWRFTADDLIAIKFLSVEAPKAAVLTLLRERVNEFSELLINIGADRDLADEANPIDRTWPGWTLWCRPMEIPGVGATTASKLMGRASGHASCRFGTPSSPPLPILSRLSGNQCGASYGRTTSPFRSGRSIFVINGASLRE